MIFISALRDFADGLIRGFTLFFTERQGFATGSRQQSGKPDWR